ncbi:MAG TPA: hypothetical protein VKI17_09455 [Gemmataceae bacterium]|nr:hypothetical protein [Gemmataceae bacterium]
MPELPTSKKPTTSTPDELHERARDVHEMLTRLLAEINELLDKTKRLAKDKHAADAD